MALINCKECGKEVSTEAKSCPHCGATENKTSDKYGKIAAFTIAGIIGFIVVLGIIGAVGQAFWPTKKNPSVDAKYMCEKFVKERLKSPATADFQSAHDFTAITTSGENSELQKIDNMADALSGMLLGSSDIYLIEKRLNYFMTPDIMDKLKTFRAQGKEQAAKGLLKSELVKLIKKSDFVVSGYVDAQNSFGANLRSQFVCILSSADGMSWSLDHMLMFP